MGEEIMGYHNIEEMEPNKSLYDMDRGALIAEIKRLRDQLKKEETPKVEENPAFIRRDRINELRRIIASSCTDERVELDDLLTTCDHEYGTYMYSADIGNYCPSDDSYWINTKCDICGKMDAHDSNTKEYREIIRNPNYKEVK